MCVYIDVCTSVCVCVCVCICLCICIMYSGVWGTPMGMLLTTLRIWLVAFVPLVLAVWWFVTTSKQGAAPWRSARCA